MSKSTLFPIFAFPIILALGILIIPVNTDYNDHALAVQAVELTERWFVGHLISAIAFSFSIWASREILGVLQKAPWFTPIFISFGAGLYAAGLGADGIGPVAVKASGESAIIFFDGSGWWVSGVFMAATLFFGIGLFIIISNSISLNKRNMALHYLCIRPCVCGSASHPFRMGFVRRGSCSNRHFLPDRFCSSPNGLTSHARTH